MTQFLPPNLLALFAPRDPIPYLPATVRLPHEKKTHGYSGVAQFVNLFEDPKDTPPPVRVETREERRERLRRAKAEKAAYKVEQGIALWEPSGNPNATEDPFNTLFVARINYDTSESKLRREFEAYGPIKKIVMVHDKTSGKPRGYAFIEYEYERDMHAAYKYADGKKIDGRRVLVDVERGRTVKGWLPRRLGGGLGGTRRGGPDENVKHSGRDEASDRDRRERERQERSRDRDEISSTTGSTRNRSERRDRGDRADRGDRVDRDRGDRDRDRYKERGYGDRDRDRDRDRERRRSRSKDRDRDRDRDRRRNRDKARSRSPIRNAR